MWWKRKSEQLEFQALAATPNNDVDLSGHWAAYQKTEKGDVLVGVQLEQHGTAVYGWMQCKFAAAHPLQIRGIVIGNRLIANYWRPHKDGMGSGVIDLTLKSGGQLLVGSASWYNAEDSNEETYDFRWQRTAT